MEKFTGTFDGFIKYIGPRVRNLVQNSLARNLRKKVGICQHCGLTDNLHAAHVHGHDRNLLIIDALGDSLIDGKIRSVDLDAFEQRFCKSHSNPEEIFLILCGKCHKIYDSNTDEKTTNVRADSQKKIFISTRNSHDDNSVLPIELIPNDVDEFKQQLLINKRAIITVFFNSGLKEDRIWDANRFSETSNVIGNLRSRPEFRQSNWQDANINHIRVKIKNN